MIYVKKLIFAPIFLLVFGLLIYKLIPFLKSYDFIFSLSINTFIELITLSGLISLSCFLFVLFSTLAANWKFNIPIALLSSLIPMLFLDPSLGIVFAATIFVSLLITNVGLDSNLSSYLTFQPTSLLGPSIRNLSGLFILGFCIVYFLSISKVISKNSFQVPEELLDTAASISASSIPNLQTEQITTTTSQITPDQLNTLKSNPQLLQQFGINPKVLDSLNTSQKSTTTSNPSTSFIKQTIKDQIQNFVKPYIDFIPAFLTILLFLILQSITSVINLLVYPLLWLTFLILEKTGFTRFETEQRTVKKLVV